MAENRARTAAISKSRSTSAVGTTFGNDANRQPAEAGTAPHHTTGLRITDPARDGLGILLALRRQRRRTAHPPT